MKLSCLMSGIEIAETNIENFDIEVGDIADNSEEVGENDVFICLAGRSDDGHKYIENALQKRAAVIVIEKKRY